MGKAVLGGNGCTGKFCSFPLSFLKQLKVIKTLKIKLYIMYIYIILYVDGISVKLFKK